MLRALVNRHIELVLQDFVRAVLWQFEVVLTRHYRGVQLVWAQLLVTLNFLHDHSQPRLQSCEPTDRQSWGPSDKLHKHRSVFRLHFL